MKSLVTLLAAVAFSGAAIAGPVSYGKNVSKTPVLPPPAPTGCDCFGPGLAVGVFGGALLSDADDVLGGGVLMEYAFNPYIAIQGSYGLYATDSEHHAFDGALILRYPITSICVAPYALVGGGFSTNSANDGHFTLGGGLEARIPSANCMGIFADAAYNFANDIPDHTIIRLGVKFPF
ncbi:MAG: hypothetical protein KDK99_16150 [Verrucomicrobiales bacterium]|nr:hypothetical protein [Verrucomicrobiales bacterium]